MIDQTWYGVCFYPEHWPWRTAVDDIARIADAGFNFVRIGEGAWWHFEPEEGKYQFSLFDNVIDECRKRKLKVIFGTPTYCGPAWIAQKYPEVLRWDYDRTPMKHGSRRMYNYTSRAYLDLSDRIVGALADHYRGEKQIFAWQIDNEFNCHMATSYAPSDTLAFRAWLKAKYKSLDDLNAAWGTRFWSQVYNDWQQIDLPHPSVTYLNPTVLLDESRFISDTVVAYCKRQATILRKANPNWQLTHNGVFENVDGNKLMEPLDFFSHDQYPLFWDQWTGFAKNLVQARSLSFPYGVLEQQAGPGGQMSYLHRTPRPGEMRLWAMQSVAHGARLLSFFCWRTCPFGSEQHWHGLLDADGRDNRRVTEAVQFGKEFRALPVDFHAARPHRALAVLRDYDNETNDRRINTYNKQGGWDAGHWMNAAFRAHVPIDQVWPTGDWTGYRVIVAPHLKIVDQALVQKYTQFVERGGTLVLMAQSGTKNRHLHMVQQTPPGLLRKLTGVEVVDWSTLPPGETRFATFTAAGGVPLALQGFVERLKPRGADVLATWDDADPLLAGAPAITRHAVGRGRVLYVGGHGNDAAASTLLTWLIENAGLAASVDVDAEIEVIDRRSEKSRYIVLMNHSTEAQFLTDLPPGRDLIGDRRVDDGTLKLAAHDIAVLQTKLPIHEDRLKTT